MEQVSKQMMKEMEQLGQIVLPSALSQALRNEAIIDTPAIAVWWRKMDLKLGNQNGKARVSAQLKLIKHIWMDEPQFKAEEPQKWVVRSVNHDGEKHYKYLIYSEDTDLPMYEIGYDFDPIVKFDTKEEAEKWTNPQTEVVEVEDDESN